MPGFNSKNWFPAIKLLAKGMYENADKVFVQYDESIIDDIENIYAQRLNSLKKEIYEDSDLIGKRIDRHKIIALYIQLFLEKPLFKVAKAAIAPYPSVYTKLINEKFCFWVLYTILKQWNGRVIDCAQFQAYEHSFFRLLYYYKEHSEFHKRNEFFTYNLAHLVHFIEEKFTVAE